LLFDLLLLSKNEGCIGDIRKFNFNGWSSSKCLLSEETVLPVCGLPDEIESKYGRFVFASFRDCHHRWKVYEEDLFWAFESSRNGTFNREVMVRRNRDMSGVHSFP
jgi:hypothetical protein